MGDISKINSKADEVLSMDYLHADWNDIMFRNRNKNYGAYAIRKHYSSYLTWGNIVAVVLFLVAINVPNIARLMKERLHGDEEQLISAEVNLAEPPPLDPNAPPPPPPPPPVEKQLLRKATIAFVAPKVKRDEDVTEEEAPPTIDELKDVEISTVTREGSKDGVPDGLDDAPVGEAPAPKAVVEDEKPAKEAAPFKIVEQMPVYPDGEAALLKFIYENIQYPVLARENGVQGTVYITFVVERDGSITNVKTVRDIGGGCGEEAIRVVKLMPKWLPGKQRGVPVRVQFTLPIKYDLK
ncbi:MAG: energy transducer TonB [Saprospiraceae bacterium]|nr:energy transducer TonB [Saprospiraceae bacterium]